MQESKKSDQLSSVCTTRIKKIEVLLITIGNTFEWFDYIIYISLSSYLSKVFFPNQTARKGLLLVFFIFAIAYIARPVGGILLGAISDKFGRKKTFLISMSLMAIATLGIACLPSYATAGYFSLFMLLGCRLLQAFSVGGEYTTGVAYLSEKSIKRRGFVASFFIFSTICGVLLAFLFFAWLKHAFTHDEIVNWAWRIPFFLSFVFILLNIFFRTTLSPSEVFQQEKISGKLLKNPLISVLKDKKRLIFLFVLCVAFPEVAVYSYMTMMPTLISKYSGVNYQHNVFLQIYGLIVLIAALPIFGALSDVVSRKKQYIIGMVIFAILSFISVAVMKRYPNELTIILAINTLIGVSLAVSNAPIPAILAEQAVTKIRCSTFGIGYNLSTAIFGGTTPLIAEYLTEGGGYKFSFYLIFVLILSIIGISSFSDKRSKHIDYENVG